MSAAAKTLSARGESPHGKRKVGSSRPPFIVDMPATMLKCNAKLSRNARILYAAMRALAHGKTGELKIPGRRWGQSEDAWLQATEFDRKAQMCRCVRLRAMRELVAHGLVSVERERVGRFLGGRRRVVLGPCHYSVHRQAVAPRTIKSPKILQESIFSTVEEIDSQIFPNPPLDPRGLVFSAAATFAAENGSDSEGTKSSSAPQNRTADDDDSGISLSDFNGASAPKGNPNRPVEEEQTHVEKILDRAAATLERRGENPLLVAEALSFIDQRSHEAGTVPGSERYYIVAYETLLQAPDDLAEVTDLMIRKKRLRDKFIPGPIIPKEKDEEKIRFVHQVVEEAARIGRPASEILGERLGQVGAMQ